MQQAQKDERNVEDFQKLVRPFFPVINETFRTDDSRPGFWRREKSGEDGRPAAGQWSPPAGGGAGEETAGGQGQGDHPAAPGQQEQGGPAEGRINMELGKI